MTTERKLAELENILSKRLEKYVGLDITDEFLKNVEKTTYQFLDDYFISGYRVECSGTEYDLWSWYKKIFYSLFRPKAKNEAKTKILVDLYFDPLKIEIEE